MQINQFYWDSSMLGTGSLIMSVSLYLSIKLLKSLQYKEQKNIWYGMIIMVTAFILSYAFLLFKIIFENFTFTTQITGLILFCGSIFVFMTVQISSKLSGKILHYIENLEDLVNKRTLELKSSQNLILEQQKTLWASSKMSALGQMAGGVAHEINTPLAAITNLSGQIQEVIEDPTIDKIMIKTMAEKINTIVGRINKTILSLRSFSRDGVKDSYHPVNVKSLIEDTLSFCRERFKNKGIKLIVEDCKKDLFFMGQTTLISQVLLNLLNNSYDAVKAINEKWIKILVQDKQDFIEIRVIDSGDKISEEVQSKLFQLFFTTKEVGGGTGIGLNLSSEIIRSHQGKLEFDTNFPNTCFVIQLPKKQIIPGIAVA